MERRRPRVGVIIPAGGKGTRLGRRIPKQFLLLRGLPIVVRTLGVFEAIGSVQEIVVVVPGPFLKRVQTLLSKRPHRKVSRIVRGGSTRQLSVWNGLKSFQSEPDIVLVHDAVRPFVRKFVVGEVIREAAKYGAAVVGVPVKDTIKVELRRGYYERTLDRKRLWAVQTPQGFRFEILRKAHLMAQRDGFVGTDEASLVERTNVPVRIVEGDDRNIKITTPQDLRIARSLLDRSSR